MKVWVVLLSILAIALAAPVPIIPIESDNDTDGIVNFTELAADISASSDIEDNEPVHDLKSDEEATNISSESETNSNNNHWKCADNYPCYVSSKDCVENCEAGLLILPMGEKVTEFELYMSGPKIDQSSVLSMDYNVGNEVNKLICVPAKKSVVFEQSEAPDVRFLSAEETDHSIKCRFTANVFHNFTDKNENYAIKLGKYNGTKLEESAVKQVLKQQSFVGGRFNKFENDATAEHMVRMMERKIMNNFEFSGTNKAEDHDVILAQFENEFKEMRIRKEKERKSEEEEKKKAEEDEEEKKKAQEEEEKKKAQEEKEEKEKKEKKKAEEEEKKKAQEEEEKKMAEEAEEKKKAEEEENKKAQEEEEKKMAEEAEEKKKAEEEEEKKMSEEEDKEKTSVEKKEHLTEKDQINGNKKSTNKDLVKTNDKAGKKSEKVSDEPQMRTFDDDEEEEDDEDDEDSDGPSVRSEEEKKKESKLLLNARSSKKNIEDDDDSTESDKEITKKTHGSHKKSSKSNKGDSSERDDSRNEDAQFMAPDSSSIATVISSFMFVMLVLMF